MTRTVLPALALAAFCLFGSGCSYGLIYTHTVYPLDDNLNSTLTTESTWESDRDVKHFSLYVNVAWDSNAIGDIARKRGFRRVDYADLELLSVLGIWRRYTVHVYGQ